jgi:hypothetical protein
VRSPSDHSAAALKGLFPADGDLRSWRLIECRPTSTGALLTTYARAAELLTTYARAADQV